MDEESNAEVSYDLDLINGLRHDRKFCTDIEKIQINFIKDETLNQYVIPKILDKLKRKLVHKICDRFSIQRTYVDKTTGDIVIVKTSETKIPGMTIVKYLLYSIILIYFYFYKMIIQSYKK